MPKDGYTASIPRSYPGVGHRRRSISRRVAGFITRGGLGVGGLRVLVASHVSRSGKAEAVERYGENVIVTETRVLSCFDRSPSPGTTLLAPNWCRGWWQASRSHAGSGRSSGAL